MSQFEQVLTLSALSNAKSFVEQRISYDSIAVQPNRTYCNDRYGLYMY